VAERRDFFYLQFVTESELDGAFDGLENADRALAFDLGFTGVISGAAAAQHAGGNLSVDVAAGIIYDQVGQRIAIPSTQNVDVSVDQSSVTTAVAGGGNSKIVSVYAQFQRTLSDPRVDGNSATVYFQRAESFKFFVLQGAEAVSPTPPALQSNAILLVDITRTFGVNTVVTGNLSTARRQDAIVIAGSPLAIRRGTHIAAIGDVQGAYNAHVTGAADRHMAAMIDYAGGGTWADGTTNPAATSEAQFDKIISDLGSGAGTAKVNGGGFTVGAATIAGGTLLSQLQALATATGTNYAGGGTWADATTNPQATVEAQLDKIISDLASTSGSGADKIGCKARTAWLGGRTNVGGVSVFTAIDKIITDLAATSAGDDGAERIGIQARTTWLGGRTNVASDVFTAIDKIITDLAATTGADDGAERIGAATGAGTLVAGSVRSQLDDLDVNWGKLTRANAWSAANTFSDITATGTNHYKLASRSITRASSGLLFDSATGAAGIGNIFVAANGNAVQVVDAPHNSTITGFSSWVDPTNATPPAGVKISFSFFSVDITTGASTALVSGSIDPTAGASYGAAHAFNIGSLSLTLDRITKRYYCVLIGETGAGANSCGWWGTTWTTTVTEIDEG
jgi:hypothetical protein